MRVLHVVPTYLPATRYGGPIVSVHALCRALVDRGHDVSVFTTNVDGDGESDVPLATPVDIDGVKVSYFSSRHLRRLYWSPSMEHALRGRIREFDLVHLHSVFLWPTLAAARAARGARVPYVVAPRGMLEKDLIRRKSRWLKAAWIGLFERRTLATASAIHATSGREARELERFGFSLPRTFIVPNGVESSRRPGGTDELSPEIADQLRRGPYVLFLGRINWKKGLDRLIAAMALAPSARLIVAGNDEEGYWPRMVALAESHGVAERIAWVGPVHGADKVALFRGALATILPSYSENFGNVVLEAMAEGCPVIVTPEVGVADIVAETGAGIVASGSPDVLGSTIAHVTKAPEEWKRMGERGRASIERRFTWGAVAQQMESAYASVCVGS